MTPIPTPEALYRRLRPEPDSANDYAAWKAWQGVLLDLQHMASSPALEIAAAFMLLGMMEGWCGSVDTMGPTGGYAEVYGPDNQYGEAKAPTPAAALYAAIGAAIDLRRV